MMDILCPLLHTVCKSYFLQAGSKSPLPSSVSSQAYVEAKCHDHVTSDSDRSSVDFCDLVVSKHKLHFSDFFGIITIA